MTELHKLLKDASDLLNLYNLSAEQLMTLHASITNISAAEGLTRVQAIAEVHRYQTRNNQDAN